MEVKNELVSAYSYLAKTYVKLILISIIWKPVAIFCTVLWRGEKYRVECTPSHLLSLATKIAEIEATSYPEVYRQIVGNIEARYNGTRHVVTSLLAEK